MLYYKYSERQIIAIMKFTGFTRQESIEYFNALTDRHNKMMIGADHESKMFDRLIKSSNSQ